MDYRTIFKIFAFLFFFQQPLISLAMEIKDLEVSREQDYCKLSGSVQENYKKWIANRTRRSFFDHFLVNLKSEKWWEHRSKNNYKLLKLIVNNGEYSFYQDCKSILNLEFFVQVINSIAGHENYGLTEYLLQRTQMEFSNYSGPCFGAHSG